IHGAWRPRNAHAPALSLPSPCASARRSLAGFVAISEYDHLTDIIGKIERPQPRSRERGPRGMPGRQQGGKTGFDTFADHQHMVQNSKPHCAATARTQHHLLRTDRSLSGTVAGEVGTVDCYRHAVSTARY